MSKDNVVDFTGVTRLDIDPQKVLNSVLESKPKAVFVVSWDEDGLTCYSSKGDNYENSYMLQSVLYHLHGI